MNAVLAFRKKSDRQNSLYDEFFWAAEEIKILAFNFDGSGAALCRCDGQLQAIPGERLARIIFGVKSERLLQFLTAIFDADCQSADLERRGEVVVFHDPKVAAMPHYDLGNLAKHTCKELVEAKVELVRYYEEIELG